MSVAAQVVDLCQRSDTLAAAERGLLDVLLDRGVNVESPSQMAAWLYGKSPTARIPKPCAFPARLKRGTGSETAGEDALLALHRQTMGWICSCGARSLEDRKTFVACKASRNDALLRPDPRLALTLRLKWLLALRSLAGSRVQRDGRVRCSINLASGTDFGTATYPLTLRRGDEVGWALGRTPARLCHLLQADAGHWMGLVAFQDADLWVVGAEAAACGDGSLLGVLREGPIKDALEAVILRLTAFGHNPASICRHLAASSYEETGVPACVDQAQVKTSQDTLLATHNGLRLRQEWIRMRLRRDGFLTSPAGCRRTFFANKSEPATEREAFAWGPRVLQNHLVERLWGRCWADAENWPAAVGEGNPVIQPLLTLPDGLLLQWPRERHDWAVGRMMEWAENSVVVAGTTLIVPVTVGFGENWATAAEAGQLVQPSAWPHASPPPG